MKICGKGKSGDVTQHFRTLQIVVIRSNTEDLQPRFTPVTFFLPTILQLYQLTADATYP